MRREITHSSLFPPNDSLIKYLTLKMIRFIVTTTIDSISVFKALYTRYMENHTD